nr:MAG TPA: hypothetical protein [Caudoviricetes sp.]
MIGRYFSTSQLYYIIQSQYTSNKLNTKHTIKQTIHTIITIITTHTTITMGILYHT